MKPEPPVTSTVVALFMVGKVGEQEQVVVARFPGRSMHLSEGIRGSDKG